MSVNPPQRSGVEREPPPGEVFVRICEWCGGEPLADTNWCDNCSMEREWLSVRYVLPTSEGVTRVTTYLTADDMPVLHDWVKELQTRVELLHVSVAYGPTPLGAVSSHAWYALVIYDVAT